MGVAAKAVTIVPATVRLHAGRCFWLIGEGLSTAVIETIWVAEHLVMVLVSRLWVVEGITS